ncbi:LuxR C-terminal-related transcriptional regulator [Streptomyces sp. NPDC055186]
MTSVAHTEHGAGELCTAGTKLYERALYKGRLAAREAREAPCALDLGLLRPDVEDPSRLEPVAPTVALQRLLRYSGERIVEERRREERLAETFQSLMRAGEQPTKEESTPALGVLGGKERINQAIAEELAEAADEVLAIHPHSGHNGPLTAVHQLALRRDQEFLDRGGRIRTLYQHTLRHSPTVLARYTHLSGDVEARTLDEVTERLILFDRKVAFIPANEDRTFALEVRHPALITFFVTAFDRLWHLATPMHPRAVQPPSLNGITARQRAIARFLVEGHTDAVIADRLGMNVRTARVHIAKLASTLGSRSRAQLGYLIGQSGILDRAE